MLVHLVLAQPADPPLPDTITIPLLSWGAAFLVFLLFGIILSLIAYGLSKVPKGTIFSYIASFFALLSYAGAVAVLNVNLFHNAVQTAGGTITNVVDTETELRGKGAGYVPMDIVFLLIALAAVLWTFWRGGRFGIISGAIFGISVIIATSNGQFEPLSDVLNWWYGVVGGWIWLI